MRSLTNDWLRWGQFIRIKSGMCKFNLQQVFGNQCRLRSDGRRSLLIVVFTVQDQKQSQAAFCVHAPHSA